MIYEENIFQKNPKKVNMRFALCYPNIYRTAMSSLGYEILYNYINENESYWCERIIYPETSSIESQSPMKDFNIISFSLQYEEDYFNLMEMMKKSGIPLKRKDRTEEDPLIIAGGPCATANPIPLSDYIDLFVIGEGESVLKELIECYEKNGKDLKEFLNIQGIYIPEFNNKTKIAIVEDMNNAYHVTYPIISKSNNKEYETVFNDSIMLNVSRGCTRGCRFCMSGYLYRPTRETNLRKLIEIATEARKNSGINKITLIGAAVSDYSKINELIAELENQKFKISTPSLRIDSLNEEKLKNLKKGGLKTLTIAPESIPKLRQSMNKDIDDKKLFEVIRTALKLNLNIKLYFLVGIPNESQQDIENLKNYIQSIADLSNKKSAIKFSVNPVVPKPHSPLQWESYNFKDIKNKIKYLKKNLKKINIKFESPKKSLIQYILSCSDSTIGELIEKSLDKDITLKEWQEHLPNYKIDDPLPWDNIDIGVKKSFLKIEHKRIYSKKKTPWCVNEKCYNCGAC